MSLEDPKQTKNLIVLHPNQTKIFKSNKPYRVVVAGRKFGKSTLALAELLRSARINKFSVFICPTYKMAKNTLWLDHIKKFIPQELIAETNETELRLTMANGNRIQLFGAEDPDRLRGLNINFVVMDEFQDFRPSSWELVIEPNLLASKGRALFLGTPKGKNNILSFQYETKNEDYESWHFTSYDSPLIDKARLDSIRERLISQGKEDVWKQEYLAQFTTIAGLIFTNWDSSIHVKEKEIAGEGSFGISVDRGIENPSAVGFYNLFQKNGETRVHMFDEIYKSNLSSRELVELIKLKIGSRYLTHCYCDPSAKDFILTAQEMGLNIQPASREGAGDSWVLEGISKCKDMLAKSPIDGEPRFTVSPRCKNFIWEIENYLWDEQPDNEQGRDKPRKINDHNVDQWRYFMVSLNSNVDNFDQALWDQAQDEERKRLGLVDGFY